jgi:hypothetical protein
MQAQAQSPEAVRQEIAASYVKATEALRLARSIDDLDELNRSFDTSDWISIVPGRSPQTWSDLRKYPFAGLTAPFDSMTLLIDKFDLEGDTAILNGSLRVSNAGQVVRVPLKETWVKTVIGWKRKVHEKLGPPVQE